LPPRNPHPSPLSAPQLPFQLPPAHEHLEVGGRLRHFLPFWKDELETSAQLLQAVEGYSPPFTSQPPLSFPKQRFSTPSQGPFNDALIDQEVAALIEKGAIEEVALHPPSLGFVSNIFLVQKKNGKMRPVINLKRLNAAHLDTPHFRMETLSDVRQTVRPGDWAVSIDLKDAYFHVPIAQDARKYLRFGWRGRLFQFCVLPFGLSPGEFQDQLFPARLPLGPGGGVCLILWMCSSLALFLVSYFSDLGTHLFSAPRIFTLLAKRVKAKLGRLGIRTIFYLDDILVLGSSFQICLSNSQESLSILMRAGFLINWEKSSLIPTTSFTFLGMLWNSVEGLLSLPEDKLVRLRSQASLLLRLPAPTCRQVMVLTGFVAAFHRAVPLLRLKGRFVQRSLNSVYSSEVDLPRKVILLPEARRDLQWIVDLQLQGCGGPLWHLMAEDCAIEVQTDASGHGWGVWFQGRLFSGHWDSTTIRTHIK
jgi:hypothetical protein